ncbi:hypothetical protein ZOSMA_7549G00010, partial [Zostera marina]
IISGSESDPGLAVRVQNII